MRITFGKNNYDVVKDIVLKYGGFLDDFIADDVLELGDVNIDKYFIEAVLDDMNKYGIEYEVIEY